MKIANKGHALDEPMAFLSDIGRYWRRASDVDCWLLMKPHTIGRITSAVIIGVLLAGAVHLDHLKRSQMGREEFLVRQGERFDRHFTKPDPVAVELFVGVFMAGALFGAYELLAFGISQTLKGLGASKDSS